MDRVNLNGWRVRSHRESGRRRRHKAAESATQVATARELLDVLYKRAVRERSPAWISGDERDAHPPEIFSVVKFDDAGRSRISSNISTLPEIRPATSPEKCSNSLRADGRS